MTVVAHIGHWYHGLIYVAPVAVVMAMMWWTGRGD